MKKYLHKLREFLIENLGIIFLLLMLIGFCYYLVFPSIVWCFNNFYLLLKIILGVICGLGLFSFYIWPVKKIKIIKVRAFLYVLFFFIIWVFSLSFFGIDEGITHVVTTSLAIPLLWLVCLYFDKNEVAYAKEDEKFGGTTSEDIILFVSFVYIICLSICFVLIFNHKI